MIIRPWLYEDNKEIFALKNECFENFWSYTTLSDTFMQDNFVGFVAIDNDKIIGFIALVWCVDECEIELIAVKNEYRRLGVASQLLQSATLKLNSLNVKNLFLEVRRSNESAINFYKNQGFNEVGVRKNYYENSEDALIMTKTL